MPASAPQPVLAPLTPAAIFLVATIDEGGESRRCTTRCRHLGSGALDRLPRSDQAAVGGHLDRLRRVGPAVLRPAPRRAAPVRRAARAAAITPRRRRAICCSTSAPSRWTSASSWPPSSSRRWPARSPIVDEVHGFKFFDNRDLMGFVDGTENPDGPIALSAPPRSATRIPISPAAATCTCRSTCTTWARGTRCRSRSRSG